MSNGPEGRSPFFASNLAMALYAELRSFGLACPWPGSDDEIIDQWIDARLKYVEPETGLVDCSGVGGYLWYSLGPDMSVGQYVSNGLASTLANGMFKIMVAYEHFDWEIHHQEQIIDFLIDERVDPRSGFQASTTCGIFDPMMVAWVIRRRGCDHRREEIDAIAAKSFLAFRSRWNFEEGWFKNDTWQEKHNVGVVPYMAAVLLELPFVDVTTFYDWRRSRVISRAADGTVTVNKVVF